MDPAIPATRNVTTSARPSCADCYFFNLLSAGPDVQSGVLVGECRFNPPQLLLTTQQVPANPTMSVDPRQRAQPQIVQQPVALFPRISGHEWCGQFWDGIEDEEEDDDEE